MTRRIVALCPVLCLLAPGSAPAQEELAWKWKEGDTFWVQTTTQVKQLMVLEDPRGDVVKTPEQYRAIVGFGAAAILPRRVDNDREVRAEHTHFCQLLYSVKQVNPDGSAVLTQKLERAELRSKVRKEEQLLQGMELTLHCTRLGVVTKVEGQQKLLDRLKDGDENREEVLKQMLSEDSLKKSATQALGFLPDKPAVSGLTWERPADLNLGPLGKLAVVHSYRLDKIDRERATIKTTSRVNRYDPGNAAIVFHVTAGNFSTAESSGALRFDPSAGRLVDAESKTVLEGALTIKNGDDVYRTRLTQEQAVKTQLFDKKPSQ